MALDNVDVQYFLQVHEEVGTISDNDVSVSCPMCREGRSWGRKHRLHMYIKPSYDTASIHCWNCGYTSNIFGYLKEFFPGDFSSYKKAKSGKGFAELRMAHADTDKPKTNELNFDNVDIGMDMSTAPVAKEIPKIIEEPKQINMEGFAEDETPVDMAAIQGIDIGFSMDFGSSPAPKPKTTEIIPTKESEDGPFLVPSVTNLIDVPDEAKKYIENRGISVQDSWLYSPKHNKIKFNNVDINLSEYIIVPLTIGDKWYGFQALAWKEKRFFIYMVTGNSGYKVENWDKINKDEPVYIFESIYDRLSSGLENSVAALGANLHDDRIKELKQPVFCLDNTLVDEKAKEETIKYLHLGYKALIWPQGSEKFKDTNDLRKLKVPYEKISKMITANIHQGIAGTIRAKMIN